MSSDTAGDVGVDQSEHAGSVETPAGVRDWRETAVAVCFGDSAGLTLFLVALAFLVVTWRVGTFFNDIGLLVPAIRRLAAGHLSLGAPGAVAKYYPGMHYHGGQIYARNYGQVAVSLPAYWVATALGPTAVRALVVVGWSLLVVAVADRAGRQFDRRRRALAAGGTLAGVALLANLLTFEPLDPGRTAILALQSTSILFGAFTGVLVYRLLARRHGTRIGLAAGAVTVLASPVGFWAPLPKRHAFTAFLVTLALYGLVRSRDVGDETRLGQAGFRALAYASAGFLSWIHAPEGFTLFLAVAAVDVPTAPRNDARTLAVLAAAVVLSLVPFAVTNVAISGSPVTPPRFLRAVGAQSELDLIVRRQPDASAGTSGAGSTSGGGSGATTSSNPSGSGDGSGGIVPLPSVGEMIAAVVPPTVFALLERGLFRYLDGMVLSVTDFDRLRTVFLRWNVQGYDPGSRFFGNGTNLSVLASLPVAAVLLARPLRDVVQGVRTRAAPSWEFGVGGLFALVASALFVSLYLPDLPINVMVTVRYIHPVYPLLVYGVFRQRAVRNALTDHVDDMSTGYAAAVAVGTPLALGLILFDPGVLPPSPGVVLQAYSDVALVAAGALAVAFLAGDGRRAARAGAVTFGLAAGVTTTFLLLTSFVVFHFGSSALPAVDALADAYANALFS